MGAIKEKSSDAVEAWSGFVRRGRGAATTDLYAQNDCTQAGGENGSLTITQALRKKRASRIPSLCPEV